MNETPNTLEIQLREKNKVALSLAIEAAKEDLIKVINFTNEEDEYKIIKTLELIDRNRNQLECELLLLFLREYREDGNIRKRELGIIVAPKGKLRTEVYEQNLSAFEKTEELVLRTWKLLTRITRKNSSSISIQGGMETNSEFDGLGLGLTIFTKGEEVKTQISHLLANSLGKQSIESSITDGSVNGWTSRHISKLSGYTLDTSVSKGTSYKKVETAPFSN